MGTGVVDVAMNSVVLDDVDASALVLTAVAAEDVLLLEAIDAEVDLRLLQCWRMSHLPWGKTFTSRALLSSLEQAWRPWHQSGFRRITAGSLARSSLPR